ncbi:MAG: metallophosphoesterase family protein [Myxococcota bacterium]
MVFSANEQPPEARPIGLISDVHGNLPALTAVLREFDREGVGRILVAGDLILGGDAPLETWRALVAAKAQCVRGLSDRALVEVDPDDVETSDPTEKKRLDAFRATRSALGELVLEQLRRLPETLRLPLIDGSELILVHGSPADSTLEIGHDLTEEEVRFRIADDPADIVVCGSTHVPVIWDLGDQRVINVGSVGMAPEGRVAHYGLLRPRMGGAELRLDHVEY